MSISDASSIVQTIAIVVGLWLAYRWRDAISYDKKVDLAMNIGESAYHFREAFKAARNEFGRYKKGEDEIQPNWIDTANELFAETPIPLEEMQYDGQIRLKSILIHLIDMRLLMWKASILFEPKLYQTIQASFDELEVLHTTFEDAIYERNRQRSMSIGFDVEKDNVIGTLGARDRKTFGDKINAATDHMLEILRQIVRGKEPKVDQASYADWRPH